MTTFKKGDIVEALYSLSAFSHPGKIGITQGISYIVSDVSALGDYIRIDMDDSGSPNEFYPSDNFEVKTFVSQSPSANANPSYATPVYYGNTGPYTNPYANWHEHATDKAPTVDGCACGGKWEHYIGLGLNQFDYCSKCDKRKT